MNYSKTWYQDSSRIANPSEISLIDKNELTEREKNILENLMNNTKMYETLLGCK